MRDLQIFDVFDCGEVVSVGEFVTDWGYGYISFADGDIVAVYVVGVLEFVFAVEPVIWRSHWVFTFVVTVVPQ